MRAGPGPGATGRARSGTDGVDALGVAVDDVQQLAVVRVQPVGFVQQLSGVVDGGQRIADFVGNAGGQPAQGGQLDLLRGFADPAGVLEKYEDRRRLAGAQSAEVGNNAMVTSADRVGSPAG